jgi:hypothetical protein
MRPVAFRVVFLSSLTLDIMLIIHMLSILLRLMLRALLVPPILALCLRELINFCCRKAGEEFFGELVGYWLA